MLEEKQNIDDAENCAKTFKYYLQFKNSQLKFVIPFNRISAKCFYSKYIAEFNKLQQIFSKYNIDSTTYIRFFIEKLGKSEKDIKADLVSNNTFIKYVDWLKYNEKLKTIYNYFLKSARNIAEESIQLGYYSTKDYIRHLIANKKLGEYYISGKISLYYFAAIPNFKKIIAKLDSFSKDEFKKIYDRFEMYNAEINAAFLKMKNQKVNPIKFTDDLLFKIRSSDASDMSK